MTEDGRVSRKALWQSYEDAEPHATSDQAVTDGFFAVISDHLQVFGKEAADALEAKMRKRWGEAIVQNATMVQDELSRTHLGHAAMAFAAYQTLLEVVPQEKALGTVEKAFTEPLRETVRTGTAAALDSAPDGFALMRDIAASLAESYFGATFGFEVERDDTDAYLQGITRCFYHDFFVTNGTPELTPAFCASDGSWIGGIDSECHGVRFERPTTLGWGHDRCRFHFYRTASLEAASAGSGTPSTPAED